VNPSTAFATVFADELARCGVREAVLAPGSRSAPMALALHALDVAGRIRLHVRIDERAAAFTALGLAKAGAAHEGSRRPVVIVCTSGTAAANFHPAVIEASESGVPLLVLTADRPPELRGAGASQTIDQVKLYGDAVRWYADPGAPERRPGAAAAWRSLACQAVALASGAAGTFPGPVHVNLPFREPLVPDDPSRGPAPDGASSGNPGTGDGAASSSANAEQADWPDSLDGRPNGEPWTRPANAPRVPMRDQSHDRCPSPAHLPAHYPAPLTFSQLVLPWTERGVVVCGDGDYDPEPLVTLAEQAGWPVLAEPSSNARRGPNALTAYQYLLSSPQFMAAHRPDVIISAGRPGLSRPQSALLRTPGARLVVIAQGPGHWADQARMATDVAAAVSLTTAAPPAAGAPPFPGSWLAGWLSADAAARAAVNAILDSGESPSPEPLKSGSPSAEPLPSPGGTTPRSDDTCTPCLSEMRLARDLVAGLPGGALLWIGSSMPVRDADSIMRPRTDIRVLASRGASGIDGAASSAIGAALAYQAAGGGPAFAVLGDLTFVHDAAGLALGPAEPRPDLCLIVVNNDGGAIFSTLEQARLAEPFERVFGTPHGTDIAMLAGANRIPYTRAETPDDLAKAIAETEPGSGLRIIEARTDRAAEVALRARLRAAALAALP
jgi:2-succinyl-5-enolpyruvyl-6-hydroxy-3-cyclohexene-1-carboxylate synthase